MRIPDKKLHLMIFLCLQPCLYLSPTSGINNFDNKAGEYRELFRFDLLDTYLKEEYFSHFHRSC